MGGGFLASKSGWVANYQIYLFAVLVLITVLALVPLNSLPIDDGQAKAEIGKIKLNKYVFGCAGWAFCTMLLHNVLNNNISLFVAEEKLGSTAQAALTSTISLIGGMLSGFIVGKIGKKFPNSTIALAFFLYGLSYILIGLCNNIFGIFVGSFVVGAAMSIAMGQFAYLISIVVDPVSTSMVLGVYQAINSIGGVVSPFLVNSLTAVFHVNAFVVSGILALLLAAVALGGKFQKKLLAFAGMQRLFRKKARENLDLDREIMNLPKKSRYFISKKLYSFSIEKKKFGRMEWLYYRLVSGCINKEQVSKIV